MRIRVKICGVSEAGARDAAVAAGADWVGFVFHPASPRRVTPDAARSLAAGLPAGVGAVALLVEPDDEAVAAVRAALPRAALQLYAGEARVGAIRAATGGAVEIWRAVPLAPGASPPARTLADRLVVEAAPGSGDRSPGGHGTALDWSALLGWQAPVPWLLAGGLTPRNVAEALTRSGADAVDVSSGVERVRGKKDADLIAAFIAAATARRTSIR